MSFDVINSARKVSRRPPCATRALAPVVVAGDPGRPSGRSSTRRGSPLRCPAVGRAGNLDRQMGAMTIAGNPLAVTVANRRADGSHQTGTRNLSAIARWLADTRASAGSPPRPPG